MTENLENINFEGKPRKVTSPTSLTALRKTGLLAEELFKESLADFKANHPEFANFSQEKLQKRYAFFESRRQKHLEEARAVQF